MMVSRPLLIFILLEKVVIGKKSTFNAIILLDDLCIMIFLNETITSFIQVWYEKFF